MERFICLARMHHIRGPNKYRRLRQAALKSDVIGLVKKGRPGVLLVQGTKSNISGFLKEVRGLRYLEFRHLDTRSLSEASTTSSSAETLKHIELKRRSLPEHSPEGIAGTSGPGLTEVEGMNDVVQAAEKIGLKDWVRKQFGMIVDDGQ